ncbi:hypothetical protein Y032_0244g3517 [Ancylostoma ceylanicum]|uniref:Uncharacterized protein n=1 Tax=Ancylostoma ceylanicum TaxID=53326 RepID=A0A016SE29_9BILA|nr:hypothetical protein Y032_0244g3517 [Ancylostoma ceylanicum]
MDLDRKLWETHNRVLLPLWWLTQVDDAALPRITHRLAVNSVKISGISTFGCAVPRTEELQVWNTIRTSWKRINR